MVNYRKLSSVGTMVNYLRWLYCLVIVMLLVDPSTLVPMSERRLILSQTEILVATGDTLQLTCTLEGFPPDMTSENLYFEPMDDNSRTERVNDTTLLFERTNMTREQSLRHIACHIDDYRDIFQQTSVTVADRPVKPSNINCVVYNWENMTCRWEPAVQDTGIATNQSLAWRIKGSCDSFPRCPFFHCPHYGDRNSSCTWKSFDGSDSYKSHMEYSLVVTVANALGSVASNRTDIDNSFFVKPSAVTVPLPFPPENILSHSLVIEWQHPHADQVLFQFTYSSQWNMLEFKTVNTTNRTLTLLDLEPFTVYTINIKCIPLVQINSNTEPRGFWSDVTTFTCATSSDVPGEAPALTAGGYRIATDELGTRSLEIFWQSIPERYRHGQIRKYHLVLQNLIEVWDLKTRVADSTKLSEIYASALGKDADYGIAIYAETDKGYNASLPWNYIIIPKTEAQPPLPQNFVVLGDETSGNVYLNWTSVDDALGYTVYWCITSMQHQVMYRTGAFGVDKCHDELHWQVVPANHTTWTLSFSDNQRHFQRILFGLSVEMSYTIESKTKTVSSGLTWNDCTYNVKNGVVAPKKFNFAVHQQAESLLIEWTRPSCLETNYISHYIVSYCNVDESGCDDELNDWTEATVDNPSTMLYTINNLKADGVYRVRIKSASYLGHSAFTQSIEQRVLRRGLSTGAIVGIVIGGIVVVLIVIFGTLTIYSKCKKSAKKLIKLDIVVPDRGDPHAFNQMEMQYSGYNHMSDQEQEPMLITFTDSLSCQKTQPISGDNGQHHQSSEAECLTEQRGPVTTPTEASDVVISPYTQTYLDSEASLPSNIRNGAPGHSNGSVATVPSQHGEQGNGLGADSSTADSVSNERVLPPINCDPMNFTDSPYIQMPSSRSGPPGECSGTGISPYSLVEQTMLESPLNLPQPLRNSLSDTGGPSTTVSNLPPVANNDDRLASENSQTMVQTSVTPAVDGYVSWPPPEPSGNELC